jgi:DNA-binding response OmpR family regulator
MEPYQILVVEDDPAIGQSLLDGLKYYGFRAELCGNGASGMNYAKQHLAHLIILDIRPQMDPDLTSAVRCVRLD